MRRTNLLARAGALIAIGAGVFLAFAAGLHLMNLRADWALALGALLVIAAPILGASAVWRLIKEDETS
jgi:hypothetical protein